MKRLIIIGSGGHGRVVADYAENLKEYQKINFLDNSYGTNNTNGVWQVIGKENDWLPYIEEADFIVAFSDNLKRLKFTHDLLSAQAKVVNIIHPSAIVSPHISIGVGNIIAANTTINYGCTIGNGVIINTAASVDHDCNLADGVHISPGANIAGGITIGEHSWIGIGSSVIEGLKLASNTQVGAGAVVTQNTQGNALYVGVPAKPIKSLTPNK